MSMKCGVDVRTCRFNHSSIAALNPRREYLRVGLENDTPFVVVLTLSAQTHLNFFVSERNKISGELVLFMLMSL